MKHSSQFSSVITVAAILMLPIFALFAQEHHHEAPHGGTVITVGNYHFEMVVVDTLNAALIYLLDGKEKILPVKDISGKAIFLFPDKTKQTIDLIAQEDHFLAAPDSADLSEFTLIVTLNLDGKSNSGRFKFKAEAEEEHDEHEHHEEKEEPHHEHDREHQH